MGELRPCPYCGERGAHEKRQEAAARDAAMTGHGRSDPAPCGDCIFRADADGFRCVAKVGAEPVEECWGYIRREDGGEGGSGEDVERVEQFERSGRMSLLSTGNNDLFDDQGRLVGAYNATSGYGMFADSLFKCVRTCRFEPEELSIDDPARGRTTFVCSRCGGTMKAWEPSGWFDAEPPYLPHFKFCPHCGAEVAEYRGE